MIAELPSWILHRTEPLLFRRIATHLYVLGCHVAILQSVVRLRPWAAGIVGTEDAEQASCILLEQPDEAVAKHGVGRLNHLRFQSVKRVERFFDVGQEARRWLSASGVQALKEEVVVAGH
jgi:hypothetical protein